MSQQDGKLFNWYCDGDVIGVPCKHYGSNGMHCGKDCLLENDDVKKKRMNLQETIRDNILEMIETMGSCIVPMQNEILYALLLICDLPVSKNLWLQRHVDEEDEYLIIWKSRL